MDPAGDLFEGIEDGSVYLNSDDAVFVDSIHTNSYGQAPNYEPAVADVDIYPHNGANQPKCPPQPVSTLVLAIRV